MPELPEVETVVKALRDPLVGRTFTGFRSLWLNQIVYPTGPDPEGEINARIQGRTVTGIWRRAKYIVMALDDGAETLIVHLKMTGHLAILPSTEPLHPHVRNLFHLADGADLRFRDMRKFGRIYLVHDPDQVLGKLGPEPLSDQFTLAFFRERLKGRSRVIKPLLLDQGFVAGIGNIYADEALFEAKIRPERGADTLKSAETKRLHAAIRNVLSLGIEREGASISDYVKPDGTKGDMQNAVNVFRRTGHPCYTCGNEVKRIVLGQRSTHFCPHCQK